MRTWLFMMGGLAVWTAHLLGVYGIASIADIVAHAEVAAARWAVAGLTAACAAADVGLLAAARRSATRARDRLESFSASTAGLAAGVSLVAVIWQGLPALIGA